MKKKCIRNKNTKHMHMKKKYKRAHDKKGKLQMKKKK